MGIAGKMEDESGSVASHDVADAGTPAAPVPAHSDDASNVSSCCVAGRHVSCCCCVGASGCDGPAFRGSKLYPYNTPYSNPMSTVLVYAYTVVKSVQVLIAIIQLEQIVNVPFTKLISKIARRKCKSKNSVNSTVQ